MKITREEWTLDQLIRALSDLKTDYGGDLKVYLGHIAHSTRLKEVGHVDHTYGEPEGIVLD